MTKRADIRTADHRRRVQASIIRKLVADPQLNPSYDSEGNRRLGQPPTTLANTISTTTAQILDDVESLRQLLPDVEVVDQILISSILSPKDLSTPHLTYSAEIESESTELLGLMLNYVEDFFTKTYQINKKLPTMLRDMLFKTGSHISLIIPESTIDRLINGGSFTLESAQNIVNEHFVLNTSRVQNIGLISDPEEIAKRTNKEVGALTLQSFMSTSTSDLTQEITLCRYVNVIDNPEAVKVPSLFDQVRKEKANRQLSSQYSILGKTPTATLQAEKDQPKVKKLKIEKLGANDAEIERTLADHRDRKTEQMVELGVDDSAPNVGYAVEINVGADAVVPICGNTPDQHLAYLFILDQQGQFINTRVAQDHYRDLQQNYSRRSDEMNSSVSSILQELRGSSTSGGTSGFSSFEEATRVFSEAMERRLFNIARTGAGTEDISIGDINNISQVMLARILQQKQTQILYVPAQLVSYMAFFYNNYGVGRSLMENTRVLASMRVLVMVTNLLTAIRNSTTDTELDIQLDPTDSDPEGSVDAVVNTALRMRSAAIPLGQGNIGSMMDFINRAGITAVVSGHPDLPEMKVTKNEKSRSMVRPDTELMEELRRLHLQGFGLTPEVADASKDINLATSVIQSSLLLTKRTLVMQSEFEPQVSDRLRKFATMSEPIVSKLREIIQTNGSSKDKTNIDLLVAKFLETLEVTLPKPELVSFQALMSEFDERITGWEKALESYFADEVGQTTSNPFVNENMEMLKQSVLNHLKRTWLRSNNVFPELDALIEKDLDGKTTFKLGDIQSEHTKTIDDICKSFVAYYEKQAKKREKAQAAEGDEFGGDAGGGFGGEEPVDAGTTETPTDETAGTVDETSDENVQTENPVETSGDGATDAEPTESKDEPKEGASDTPPEQPDDTDLGM
jgi:hypothetical protein